MTKHRSMGRLEGPVVLFGGPYSNFQATQALMQAAQARDIPVASMICTGDVVAYCGDPDMTVRLLQDAGIAVVAGNCEKQLAAKSQDCGCGFEAGTTCDLLSAGWFAYASGQVDQDQRDWMGQTADVLSFEHEGKRYAVIHGGMTDIARFIWPSSGQDVLFEEWTAVEAAIGPVDGIIAGHSGIPFVTSTHKGDWINAGVIGMPPHDGGPQTRFAILDADGVTFHKLDYDVAGAVATMTRAGLTQGYHRALETGYWPSEDVLPPVLRAAALASG